MDKRRSFYKTIDIHGFTCEQAKRLLLFEINRAPKGEKKLLIIHGCNNGTVLRDMVRNDLNSPRISEIMPCFANDGETTVFLKK